MGVETGTDLWNDKYSLAGNTFAIRKDSPTGEIVQEMTTDEKGHAETPKEIANALELGTYYVTETKASNGFVNTFKPVKVELNYVNQTVALVTSNVKGQNQEITGETTLTKKTKIPVMKLKVKLSLKELNILSLLQKMVKRSNGVRLLNQS